jgi:hypothetical protein
MPSRADACGHLAIYPALNDAEFEYLSAFTFSRRHAGRPHPYDVPDNPAADSVSRVRHDPAGKPLIEPPAQRWDLDDYNTPPAGQPSLWCPWQPSCAGECLSLDTKEKIGPPVQWLEYLVEHFLAPGALAKESGLLQFANFTFDHTFGGGVAVHSLESNQLVFINVNDEGVVQDQSLAWEPMRRVLG